MRTEDLVVKLSTSCGRAQALFRERSPGGRIVYLVIACHGSGDVIADVWLADHDRWYWTRADGGTARPGSDGPWLGWLLDLAREHGWEP